MPQLVVLRKELINLNDSEIKENYTTTFDNLKTKYIKVVVRYYGKLPEWHHAGSQYESMIFSDEIILK